MFVCALHTGAALDGTDQAVCTLAAAMQMRVSMALILLAGWMLLVGAPKIFSYHMLFGENFGLLAGSNFCLEGSAFYGHSGGAVRK